MSATHVIVLKFTPVGNHHYGFDSRRTYLMSREGAYADIDRADKMSEAQARHCASSAARSIMLIDTAVVIPIEEARARLKAEAEELGEPVFNS